MGVWSNWFNRLQQRLGWVPAVPLPGSVIKINPTRDYLRKLQAQEEQQPAAASPAQVTYWWECPTAAAPPCPEFEAINNKFIQNELHRKVETGSFSIVEIPDNILRAIQIMGNPEFNYAQVSALITRSPALATEFLRVVNSTLYNRGGRITDLRVALPRLGHKTVKAMLYLYSSKMGLASNTILMPVVEKVVDHCQATARIAGYLSQRYYPDPEGAFMAGLLHDVGKLAILQELSESYDLPAGVGTTLSEESFDEIFPGLHEVVGEYLARHWSIGEEISNAIMYHHHFFDASASEKSDLPLALSALINLSDIMARIAGHGRHIDAVDIFAEMSAVELGMVRDTGTIEFLQAIPELLQDHD